MTKELSASLFIDASSPWQNGWIEAFNARRRDGLFNRCWILSFHVKLHSNFSGNCVPLQ
jgi:hypothetical protein